MIIEFRNNTYETLEKREELVKMLACIVNASSEFKPYCPNDFDSYYWQIHSGNDWGVGFDQEHPNRVKIRYQCKSNQYEEALCAWLAVMFRCTIVEKNNYE